MPVLAIVDTRRVYDWLFNLYVPIGLGVFAAFTLTIIAVAICFHVRPPARASRRNDATKLETSYAVLLACVAGFLLYLTFHAEHQEDVVSNYEHPAVTIDVTGSRWEWTYRYPAYGITRRSGAVGHQALVVPTNEPVRFRLTSADVLHALWIPSVRYKHTVFPGIIQTVTLDFDHAGTSSGACAEYCGVLHSEMVFTVDALRPAAFRAWAAAGGSKTL